MITKINHIAIAVPDIETGKRFWHEQLGLPLETELREEREGVDVAFLRAGESRIELVSPFEENGVTAFLQKRGPGIHHLCLEVEDLDAAVAGLRADGVRFTSDAPCINEHGIPYIFIHPKSTGGVLIELYQG